MKMDKLNKVLSKKKDLSGDMEKNAKMDVVSHLRDMAAKQMKGKMGSMKKVEVASNSDEGLKEGLNKAKDIVEDPNQMAEMAEDVEETEDAKNALMPRVEGPDEGGLNHMFDQEGMSDIERIQEDREEAPEEDSIEEMSEEEIEAKLQELMAMKAKLKKV